MCCSTLNVTLNGIVDAKLGQYGISGVFQKSSGLVNNRCYWNHTNGGHAIWYDNKETNSWMIGQSADLGSVNRGINSAQDSACPSSENKYNYWDVQKDEFFPAPIDSVSIQCVTGLKKYTCANFIFDYFLFFTDPALFHFACKFGDLDEVKSNLDKLKNEGHNVNIQNSNGETCLDLASNNGHNNVAQFLLDNNADCMCDLEGSNDNSCDKSGHCHCKEGFHGRKCGTDCMCNPDGSNGNSCDKSGQCYCKEGFHGQQCGEYLCI